MSDLDRYELVDLTVVFFSDFAILVRSRIFGPVEQSLNLLSATSASRHGNF